MNDEIEFGEVEQAAPGRALRPDENRHYAVMAYGEPGAEDLAIYVDLDVLADMEDHALSDTAVELGGVLLGGCFTDERGRPFVFITDSLRAQHYESTKGSFKFTHDTWAAITRERDQFPAELQMVGWYHTHPDWGVFLSGMDMFICDNFFNKKLDVAYVIDPCRGDRGMFQWTAEGPWAAGLGTHGAGEGRPRVRRTGGFFVTASRFRAAELESYVAELSGNMPATLPTRAAAGSPPAPIVHLHQPRDPAPPWQGSAIAAALGLQFLLMALIAWKVLAPAGGAETGNDSKIVAALEKLNSSVNVVEARRKAELADVRTQARAEFLDEAFRELKGADNGAISRLANKFDQSARLTEDVAAREALVREMRALVEDTRGKLQSLEVSAKREEKRLASQIDELTTRNGNLKAELNQKSELLASLQAKLNPKTDRAAEDAWRGTWWWVGGGAAAIIALVLGAWWSGTRDRPPIDGNSQAAANSDDTTNVTAEAKQTIGG